MLKSASRQKQNNCWLIPKLHLPEKNENNCRVYIFKCVKIYCIIIFWLKLCITATCEIPFSLRLEAAEQY